MENFQLQLGQITPNSVGPRANGPGGGGSEQFGLPSSALANVSSSVMETIWCSLATVQRLQRLVWRLRSAVVDGPRGIFETFRWNVVVSCGKQTSSGPNITHLSQNVLPFLPSFPPVLSALARYCVIAGLSSERSQRAGAKIRTLPSPVRQAPGSEDRFFFFPGACSQIAAEAERALL